MWIARWTVLICLTDVASACFRIAVPVGGTPRVIDVIVPDYIYEDNNTPETPPQIICDACTAVSPDPNEMNIHNWVPAIVTPTADMCTPTVSCPDGDTMVAFVPGGEGGAFTAFVEMDPASVFCFLGRWKDSESNRFDSIVCQKAQNSMCEQNVNHYVDHMTCETVTGLNCADPFVSAKQPYTGLSPFFVGTWTIQFFCPTGTANLFMTLVDNNGNPQTEQFPWPIGEDQLVFMCDGTATNTLQVILNDNVIGTLRTISCTEP